MITDRDTEIVRVLVERAFGVAPELDEQVRGRILSEYRRRGCTSLRDCRRVANEMGLVNEKNIRALRDEHLQTLMGSMAKQATIAVFVDPNGGEG